MSNPHQLTHLQLSESILVACRNNDVDGLIHGPGFGVKASIDRESKQEVRRTVIVLQDQDMWVDEGSEFKW
jgi:hypothetical protein